MHLNRANVNAVWPAICLLTGIFVGSEVAGDPCVPTWETAVGTPGANHAVLALHVHDDGSGPKLFVGGAFQTAGNIASPAAASWNGVAWEGLQGSTIVNPTGGIQDFAVLNLGDGPMLYAAGGFIADDGVGVNGVGRWDGTDWTVIGATGRRSFPVALRTFDDGTGPALYAGGGFETIDGVSVNYLAKWDGMNWSDVGGGVSGGALTPVMALGVFDDGTGPALYVGGWYLDAGGVRCNSIAKWDGQNWTPLGVGLGGYPFSARALEVFDDGTGPALYVGGSFQFAGGMPANYIAKWDGQNWTPLGLGAPYGVLALKVFDDGTRGGPALFAGGFIAEAGGMPVNYIAKWDGQQWHDLNSTLNWEVYALEVFDDGLGESLFIGGQFMIDGGAPGNRITQYRSCINGDFDLDRDVDMSDFKEFAQCFGGARQPPSAACTPGIDADFDGDGDVDVRDYATFAQNFTGSQ